MRAHRCSRTLAFIALALAAAQAAEFRAARYGAKGDGKTLNTAAIQRAIDAAAKKRGTVVFAPGVYLTGSLFLKSGVHLRVDEGVELRGVQELAAYPVMWTRIAGVEMDWPAALINVVQQKGVKISGRGVIDGDGKIWWDKYRDLRAQYDPKKLRWAADYDCQRPRLIQIYKSSGVDLSGLTLKRSGFWTVHVCFSQNISVDGLTIRNNIGGRGPSTDGIDIDSSSDVVVQHCDIECNDDALCLKAGRDADGLRVNRPTENVVIRDCTVRAGAGGVTIGSETSGGVRHVRVSGIRVLPGPSRGIIFKSASTRGGIVEDVAIENLELEGVAIPVSITMNWNPSYSYATLPEGVANIPAYWKALLEKVPPEKGLPHFRDVRIANIRATGAREAFLVSAYPEAPLERFEFRNLDIEAKSAGTIENAADWTFVNVKIKTADGGRVVVKDSRNVRGLD